MRRVLPCIALALAAGLQGCTTLTGEPPARESGGLGEELARAEAHFRGRWYVLDRNLSCLQDKTVTFADGKATFEYFPGAEGGGTDQPSGEGGPSRDPAPQPLAVATGPAPLTLPYHIERDPETGIEALVVDRSDGEDRFWMAGPDFLLALDSEGYEVMARCD